MYPTRKHEVAGLILALLSGLRIQRCSELWCRSRHHSDPALLWLWHRPTATAQICPLAWESPYAASGALKSKKKKSVSEYLSPHLWDIFTIFKIDHAYSDNFFVVLGAYKINSKCEYQQHRYIIFGKEQKTM